MKTITVQITKEQFNYLIQEATKLNKNIDEVIQEILDIQIDLTTELDTDLWDTPE